MHQTISLKKLQRNIYTIGIIFVILLAIFIWFMKRSFLNVKVVPTNAIILVDNAPVPLNRYGNGKKTLSPGDHSIKVEADGYIGFVKNIHLKRALVTNLNIDLQKQPEPVTVSDNGKFLTKSKNFNEFLYLGDEGKTLYKAKLSINDKKEVTVFNQQITSNKLSGINDLVWSPNQDLVLFRKQDGIYLFDLNKYDFVNQTESLWGRDIGDIAWAPDNSKIAYYYAPPSGERSLIFANISNSASDRVLNLAELGIENPLLRWSPDSEWLIVIPRNKEYSKNKVYLFNTFKRTIQEVTETGDQLDAFFSPDANKILYSSYSKDPNSSVSSVISIMNRDGSEKRSLDLRAILNKINYKKDARNIMVMTLNAEKKQEAFFNFDTEEKKISGLSIDAFSKDYIKLFAVSDDDKIAIYETENGVYATKLGD